MSTQEVDGEMEITHLEAKSIELIGPIEEVEEFKVGILPGDDLEPDSDLAHRGWLYLSVPLNVWTPVGLPGPKLRLVNSSYVWFKADDFFKTALELPDVRVLKSITVLNRPHSEEMRLQEITGNAELRIDVDADDQGNVFLYRPKDIETVRGALIKIFCQLLWSQAGEEGEGFSRWCQLRPLELPDQDKTITDSQKAWVKLGEMLLSLDVTEGLVIAEFNFVLASLWGRALARVMSQVPPELHGDSFAKHEKVAIVLNDTIRSHAIHELKLEVESSTNSERQAIAHDCLVLLADQIG